MKKIYFDYQLIIDNVENREGKIDLIKEFKNYLVVYSPAYIEEIARGNIENKLPRDVDEYFSFISSLTNNNELIYGNSSKYDVIENMFNNSIGILLVNEHPETCYSRVTEYIHKNIISEEGQNNLFKRSSEKYSNMTEPEIRKEKARVNNQNLFKVIYSENTLIRLAQKIVNTLFLTKSQNDLIKNGFNINKLENNLFLQLIEKEYQKYIQLTPYYVNHFVDLLKKKDIFLRIKKDFSLVENFIQNIMAILSEEGVYFEDNKDKNGNYKRLISSIHDTTHCIYASFTDYFVTRDRRLYKKADFVYQFLNIPTKIIYVDEEREWLKLFEAED